MHASLLVSFCSFKRLICRPLSIAILLLFSLLVFGRLPAAQAGPPLAPAAQEQVGYWEQVSSDQAESWVGDNYRGLSADYEAFFSSPDLIGASYTEYQPNFGGNADLKEYIVETAYCNWSWPKEQVPQLMRPGEPYTISLSIDASMLGEMVLMDVHKTFAAFRSAGQTSGGEFAYAEVFLEKNSEASATGSRSTTATFLVPAGAQAGEERLLSLNCWPAGGLVQVAQVFTYRWVPQVAATIDLSAATAEATAAATEPAGPGPTPAGTAICQQPLYDTLFERQLHILNTYYDSAASGIPPGPYDSGSKINILSIFDSSLKPFRCGGYQQKVLAFLDRIRFDPDPCVRGLLDGLEYGPIQAWSGGHQAVVLWPSGTDWVSTGTVLDPWMTQRPAAYSIANWAAMWSPGGNFRGISGTTLAGYQGRYPTTGGTYENPGEFRLSQADRDLIGGLPVDKQERFWELDDTGKKEFLQRAYEQRARGNRTIVHCPLAAYVVAEDGRRTGLVDGEPLFEIPGVYFLNYPLQDGTSWSQFEYPLDQGYRLVLQGQGAGAAQLFVTYGVPEDSGLSASSYYYDFEVTAGQTFELPPLPASDLESGAERLAARPFTPAEAGALDELVAMQLPIELPPDGVPLVAQPTPQPEAGEMRWNLWGVLVCGLCLLGGGLAAAGGVAFYFYRRRR